MINWVIYTKFLTVSSFFYTSHHWIWRLTFWLSSRQKLKRNINIVCLLRCADWWRKYSTKKTNFGFFANSPFSWTNKSVLGLSISKIMRSSKNEHEINFKVLNPLENHWMSAQPHSPVSWAPPFCEYYLNQIERKKIPLPNVMEFLFISRKKIKFTHFKTSAFFMKQWKLHLIQHPSGISFEKVGSQIVITHRTSHRPKHTNFAKILIRPIYAHTSRLNSRRDDAHHHWIESHLNDK